MILKLKAQVNDLEHYYFKCISIEERNRLGRSENRVEKTDVEKRGMEEGREIERRIRSGREISVLIERFYTF